MEELMRQEREKELAIQDLQRTLEEKRAQLQRLNDAKEKAESELEERQARETEIDQEFAMITNTISRILDRAGGSSRVTDPVEQLEVLNPRERRECLQALQTEMNEEREQRRKETRELIRVEKEKEAKIHELQKTLEEKRAQLQKLTAAKEKAKSELEERRAREASVDQQLATITNTISGILDRAGGSGSSSRVTDPVKQLEVIGQMHQFFKTAETKTNKKSRVKPARCQKT